MIETALEQSHVLLVVIGPDWVTTTNRDGERRLLDPEDMVRIEIETALRRDLRIVPVLVEEASMPRPQDLPPSLEPLCYRSALPGPSKSRISTGHAAAGGVSPRPSSPHPLTRQVEPGRAAGVRPLAY